MIIRIKDYDEKPRIFSFAKSESVKDYLLGKDLSTGLLGNRSIIIYPENITLNLSEEETQRFSSCTDYDIFRLTAEVMPINTLIMLHLIMQYLLQTDVIQIALCVRLLSLYEKRRELLR